MSTISRYWIHRAAVRLLSARRCCFLPTFFNVIKNRCCVCFFSWDLLFYQLIKQCTCLFKFWNSSLRVNVFWHRLQATLVACNFTLKHVNTFFVKPSPCGVNLLPLNTYCCMHSVHEGSRSLTRQTHQLIQTQQYTNYLIVMWLLSASSDMYKCIILFWKRTIPLHSVSASLNTIAASSPFSSRFMVSTETMI